MFERLTDPESTKCSMSPWEWCGLDSVCKRDCFKPKKCKIPVMLRRLAECENSELAPEEIMGLKGYRIRYDRLEKRYTEALKEADDLEQKLEQYNELAKAQAEGRLIVVPDGYEYTKEFYHVVNMPKWCDEDGNGCEGCKYQTVDSCTFKPYVSKISVNTVFDALYTLKGLSLTKEEAEKELGGAEDDQSQKT